MDLNYEIPGLNGLPSNHKHASIATADDYMICRGIMRRASKNYSTASNYLPATKLPHVEALYALMRVGDDRVDVSHWGYDSPMEAIDDWESTYWRAFERGDSPHPVMRAYLHTALHFGIPRETMGAYFRAMREDLMITRFPTFADLVHYMEGSAIPVGRAITYILGVASPYDISSALVGADALSTAMQLSNFWRDVGEDWRIGRVYLPQEDLETYRYSEVDLAAGKVDSRFQDLLEFEFARTERYYNQARGAVRMLATGRWAVMSALEIYHAILPDIRSAQYNVFSRRAGANILRKFGLALKSYWQVGIS
jgi:phytoene synthase